MKKPTESESGAFSQSWASNFALFTSKIKKKNAFFIDQSAFSNFALYVVARLGQFQQLLKTLVILILNFTPLHAITYTNFP